MIGVNSYYEPHLDYLPELMREFAPDRPYLVTEFGPDGYMPQQPFSGEPLADVQAINAEMASWLRSSLTMPAADS